MYEHQSTTNPNMPLRDLFYISKLYQKMVPDKALYGRKEVIIPTPQFIIFYNGVNPQPERRILRLSDLYTIKEDRPNLELIVVQLNINEGYNEEIKACCRTLGEYMQYVDCVREYNKEMSLEDAVEKAIEDSIRKGILVDFLSQNRKEVAGMCLQEWDQERFKEVNYEEGYEDGKLEGRLKEKHEIVRKMLMMDSPLEFICELAEVSVEYVNEVKNEGIHPLK